MVKPKLQPPVLGDVLKKWRVMSQLEQRGAARMIGISASTLCRIENGETTPDAITLMAVFNWLMKAKDV